LQIDQELRKVVAMVTVAHFWVAVQFSLIQNQHDVLRCVKHRDEVKRGYYDADSITKQP